MSDPNNPSPPSHPSDLKLRPETFADNPALSAFHAQVFGPGRFARVSYRVRELATTGSGFGLIAEFSGTLAGSVHFTPLRIGGKTGATLLGPLVTKPAFEKQKIGTALVQQGLKQAMSLGAELIVLVGDLPYFSRFGFLPVPPGQIQMPGAVNPARFLYFTKDGQLPAHFKGKLEAL